MKNITLKIDDETYRKAGLQAAARGTSVSAMVRKILESLDDKQAEEENAEQTRVKRLLKLYAEAESAGRDDPSGFPKKTAFHRPNPPEPRAARIHAARN